jgi:hypothetical protein
MESLSALSNAIHDQWFDLEQVVRRDRFVEIRLFVPDTKSVSWFKRFGLGRMGRITMGVIRIEDVDELTLTDTERVGVYDINRLAYDPATAVVQVVTNIPLGFRLRVRSLSVTLDGPS